MSTIIDPAQFLGTVEAARAAAEESVLADHAMTEALAALNRGPAFNSAKLDLSTLATPTKYAGTCFAIIYRREGSAPGGRLDVEINGKVEALHPGSRIEGLFEAFSVSRNARSSTSGFASLVIVTRKDAKFAEPLDPSGQLHAPVDLLGNSLTGDFITVAEDTQPSGATPTGSFDATGWSRLRVLLSATGLVSADFTPWVREPNTGLWYPQADEVRSIPDTASSGYDRRVFMLNVDTTGRMFLEVRSLLPAGLAGVGMIVQGVR